MDASQLSEIKTKVAEEHRKHPPATWIHAYLPHVLPVGWRVILEGADGCWYQKSLPELRVCLTGAVELDGRRWLHLSVSHRKRLPTWNELVEIKELFLGPDCKAIQILPPRSEWVNICDRMLNLFSCLDADLLPDFTHGTGSL